MGFFGNSSPGYGGGQFPNDQSFGIPDYMSGINDALAQNQALGQEQQSQPKKHSGIGEFLKALAGYYGDSLTGNPVYSNSVKNRQEGEAAEADYTRRQRDQQDWWVKQQEYQAAHKGPDQPGIADEVNWWQNLPEDQKGAAEGYMRMRYPQQFTPPTPIRMESGDVVEGGGSDVTATNPQTGQKIRLNPQTGQWEAVGGASPSNGSGGFPQPF